jgi:hypothetical protein
MISKTLGLTSMVAVGLAVAANWPDLQRYVKIRQMSGGGSGHPEFVPAAGRSFYPQRHADSAADGTGDFDSAHRGGPANALVTSTSLRTGQRVGDGQVDGDVAGLPEYQDDRH